MAKSVDEEFERHCARTEESASEMRSLFEVKNSEISELREAIRWAVKTLTAMRDLDESDIAQVAADLERVL